MSRPIISDFFERKFIQKVLTKGNTEGTANRYLQEVSKFEDWLQENRGRTLLEADTSDLRVHLEEMATATPDRDEYAPTSITRRRSAVSQFYKLGQAVTEDYSTGVTLPENPSEELEQTWSLGDTKKSAGIDSQEGIYYLTPGEISRLEQHVEAPKLRNRLLCRLLFNTGVRRGELATITLEALDREERTIRIPAMKSPKPRTVTYSEEYVGFLLDRWLDGGHRDAVLVGRTEENDYLFPTGKRPHISGDWLNQMIKKAADNAGLQKTVASYSDGREIHKVTAHTLRHSYAVQAVNSGIDVRSLQRILGHEDLDTTMIYLRIAEQDYIDESRKFKVPV